MGLLSSLVQLSGVGEVSKPIDAMANLFDRLFTSDEEKEHAKAVLEKLNQRPLELQAEINKIESSHRSIFVAGWRPFIGWMCGICIGCYFLPKFTYGSYLWVRLCIEQGVLLPYPVDASGLFNLTLALLGMGSLRTLEKFGNKTK